MKLIFALILAVAALTAQAQQSYREILLVPSAAQTATGTGNNIDTNVSQIDYFNEGVLVLVNVTAVSGTSPSMTFSLEGIVNGVNYTLGSCAAITAVNKCVLFVTQVPAVVRGAWVISGTTPSFTFTATIVRQ